MQTDDRQYALPFTQRSKIKWSLHLLFVFIIVFSIGFLVLPIGDDWGILACKVVFALCTPFTIYLWAFVGLFRKQTLLLTGEFIELKSAFGAKRARWEEIYDMEFFMQSNYPFMGLVLKDKVLNRKKSFWSVLSDMFGEEYSIRISLTLFHGIDIEALYSTIRSQMLKHASQEELSGAVDPLEEECFERVENEVIEEQKSNLLIALLKVFLLSLTVGVLYGISIYLFQTNLIIIPLFGLIGILKVYDNNYRETRINWFARFFLGTLCSLQMFVAVIVSLFLLNKIPFSYSNFVQLTFGYMQNVWEEPFEHFMELIIAVPFFLTGLFYGKTFRWVKACQKIFMKKSGNYYYKQEGRSVKIYIIDPTDFVEEESKGMGVINEGCLIEKQGKTVKSLLIPKQAIEYLRIVITNIDVVEYKAEQYYKIDLGGTGTYLPYVFPCLLLCNAKRELELVEVRG